MQRRLIQEHEMEACPKRPIEMQVASLMKKFEAIVVENQVLKQELGKIQKVHQQSSDEVKQELDDLKRAHREQRELHEAKEKNEQLQRASRTLQKTCDTLKLMSMLCRRERLLLSKRDWCPCQCLRFTY